MAARREEGEHFLVQSHCTWTQGGARVPLCGALASEQADDNLWRGGTQQTLTNLAPCSENLSFEVSSCPRFFPPAKINSIKPNFTLHAAEAFSSLEVSRSLSLLRMISRTARAFEKMFWSCIFMYQILQMTTTLLQHQCPDSLLVNGDDFSRFRCFLAPAYVYSNSQHLLKIPFSFFFSLICPSDYLES